MTKEIVTKGEKNLTIANWNQDKWKKVRDIFCPTIKDEGEWEIFMELAKGYDLNPFKREIWSVPYGGKTQMFCGRDGFLSIAHKSGMFNGMHTDFGYTSKGALQSASPSTPKNIVSTPTKYPFLKFDGLTSTTSVINCNMPGLTASEAASNPPLAITDLSARSTIAV